MITFELEDDTVARSYSDEFLERFIRVRSKPPGPVLIILNRILTGSSQWRGIRIVLHGLRGRIHIPHLPLHYP